MDCMLCRSTPTLTRELPPSIQPYKPASSEVYVYVVEMSPPASTTVLHEIAWLCYVDRVLGT